MPKWLLHMPIDSWNLAWRSNKRSASCLRVNHSTSCSNCKVHYWIHLTWVHLSPTWPTISSGVNSTRKCVNDFTLRVLRSGDSPMLRVLLAKFVFHYNFLRVWSTLQDHHSQFQKNADNGVVITHIWFEFGVVKETLWESNAKCPFKQSLVQKLLLCTCAHDILAPMHTRNQTVPLIYTRILLTCTDTAILKTTWESWNHRTRRTMRFKGSFQYPAFWSLTIQNVTGKI